MGDKEIFHTAVDDMQLKLQYHYCKHCRCAFREGGTPIPEMVKPTHECYIISITQRTYMRVICALGIQQKSALFDRKLSDFSRIHSL